MSVKERIKISKGIDKELMKDSRMKGYIQGLEQGRREGAKQELLEIKAKLDKEVFYFDLDDKHVLLNYIKERLKELEEGVNKK